MFSRLLPAIWHGAANALPSQCRICHAWPSEVVCADCTSRFSQPRPRCRICALPLEGSALACARCRIRPGALSACFAAVDYAYPWQDCITSFKFGNEPGWAGTLAGLLLQVAGVRDALRQAKWAVPMPLSKGRLKERGFNQALQIARRLAPQNHRADLLLRIRETSAQSTLDRVRRLANIKGAFAVDPMLAHELRGESIVLVDDVMTSGASMQEAASTLLAAGASRVVGMVIARTDEP